ncbi:MAG: hypothetical protein ACFFBD_09405 [Candidatus Hodarchaeota archaeon]
MAISKEKAIEIASKVPKIAESLTKTPGSNIEAKKLSPKDVSRIAKETPGFFGESAPTGVLWSCTLKKPGGGIGIPAMPVRVYIDATTGEVVKVT